MKTISSSKNNFPSTDPGNVKSKMKDQPAKANYRMIHDAYTQNAQQEGTADRGGREQTTEQSLEVPQWQKKEAYLLNRIEELKRDGSSINEIAKKLGKGKTEIELLLKFQKN